MLRERDAPSGIASMLAASRASGEAGRSAALRRFQAEVDASDVDPDEGLRIVAIGILLSSRNVASVAIHPVRLPAAPSGRRLPASVVSRLSDLLDGCARRPVDVTLALSVDGRRSALVASWSGLSGASGEIVLALVCAGSPEPEARSRVDGRVARAVV